MNHRNEQISALMDEELNATEQRQAIDFLIESKTARRVWVEYHIIRDCLQHSADTLSPKQNTIHRWLNKIPANDNRISAAIAASLAVFVFLGIMLWGGGLASNSPESHLSPTIATESASATTIEDLALVSVSADDDNAAIIDRNEFYQQTHHQAVDMDGLKQVSYSFE